MEERKKGREGGGGRGRETRALFNKGTKEGEGEKKEF